MALLYWLFVVGVGAATWLAGKRACAAERRVLAASADAARAQDVYHKADGADPLTAARVGLGLTRAVERMDRAESKWAKRESAAEWWANFCVRVKEWRGKWLPYFCAWVDAKLTIVAVVGFAPETVDWLRELARAVAASVATAV